MLASSTDTKLFKNEDSVSLLDLGDRSFRDSQKLHGTAFPVFLAATPASVCGDKRFSS